MKTLLALIALAAVTATAQGAPRTVGLVLDAPPKDAEALERAATAAHMVLNGLAAVGDAEAVQVQVITAEGPITASAQLSVGLKAVHGWAGGERGEVDTQGALEGALERLEPGIEHVVIIDGGPATLSAALAKAHLSGRRVTLISDANPAAGACPSTGGGCQHASLGADVVGAAQLAVSRALDGLDDVWVTTAAATGFDVPPGALRVVAIAPGEAPPSASGEPLVELKGEAPEKRLVTARLWRRPAESRQALTIADGAGRPLVVSVRGRVVITDCALTGGQTQARWRFAAVGVPWSAAVADALSFEISGRDEAPEHGDGTITLPSDVSGTFRLTPKWKTGERTTVAGDTADCSVTPALVGRAELSAVVDGEHLEVRAAFVGRDGQPLDPAQIIAGGAAAVELVGGASAALKPSKTGATARLPRPPEGTHTLQLAPVESRDIVLSGSRLTVRVGGAEKGGEGPAWWPSMLAALLVAVGFVGYPVALSMLRRKQLVPSGSVSVSVGGSPVIDRRIGPHTAFPAILVGVRDIPIADGESLARAEVRWDGLRPTIRATVMSRPDAQGRCTPRVESCRLAEARPFIFSNVRIEFVENG